VVIVVDFGEDVQRYAEKFADFVFPRLPICPLCAAPGHVVGHGSYPRTVTEPTHTQTIPVKRLLCTACRHTLALLPTFCLPFRHYRTAAIQTVLTLRTEGRASWSAIARRFAPADVPTRTTSREWVDAFTGASARYLSRLIHQLATWPVRSVALEVAVADLAIGPTGPARLIAAVPHLVAWLSDVGLPLEEGRCGWLATLWQWGNGAKLGRLV
jgi:Domain of unknown function (DUF6431)